jgi:hypothetical protein
VSINSKDIPLSFRERNYDERDYAMCKKLDMEVECGKLAAYGVGNHLLAMGAKRCDIPIEVDGVEIVVSAELKPVTRKYTATEVKAWIDFVGDGTPLKHFNDPERGFVAFSK